MYDQLNKKSLKMNKTTIRNKLMSLSELADDIKEKLNDAEYKQFLDIVKDIYDAVEVIPDSEEEDLDEEDNPVECHCDRDYDLCTDINYEQCRNWQHYLTKFPLLKLFRNFDNHTNLNVHIQTTPVTDDTDNNEFIYYCQNLLRLCETVAHLRKIRLLFCITIINYCFEHFGVIQLLGGFSKAVYAKLVEISQDMERYIPDINMHYFNIMRETDYSDETCVFKKWIEEFKKVMPNIEEILHSNVL